MPKTRKRRAAAPARRDQLLEAAAAVIAERGFAAATVHAIAQRAGVADGTLYNHFRDKRELLEALHERLVDEETRKLDYGTAPPAGFREYLGLWLQQRLARAADSAPLRRAVVPELLVDRELRRQHRDKVLEPALRIQEAVLARAATTGGVGAEDHAAAARLLQATLLGLIVLSLLEDADDSAEAPGPASAAAAEQLARLLYDGLAPRPESGRVEPDSV